MSTTEYSYHFTVTGGNAAGVDLAVYYLHHVVPMLTGIF